MFETFTEGRTAEWTREPYKGMVSLERFSMVHSLCIFIVYLILLLTFKVMFFEVGISQKFDHCL